MTPSGSDAPLRHWQVIQRSEPIPVTSCLPEPDSDWSYVDLAGHEHRHVEGPDHYPTLRWVVDGSYRCYDCHEEHEEGHLECQECGEHVVPGTRTWPFPRYIAGPVTVELVYDDGRTRKEYAVQTAEDAEELLRDPAAAIVRISAAQEPVVVRETIGPW